MWSTKRLDLSVSAVSCFGLVDMLVNTGNALCMNRSVCLTELFKLLVALCCWIWWCWLVAELFVFLRGASLILELSGVQGNAFDAEGLVVSIVAAVHFFCTEALLCRGWSGWCFFAELLNNGFCAVVFHQLRFVRISTCHASFSFGFLPTIFDKGFTTHTVRWVRLWGRLRLKGEFGRRNVGVRRETETMADNVQTTSDGQRIF